ncbi:hypothetical protein [Pontibacter liquoris]|uniref:hypothetical protein n=1 Tax=Pontibacter liquoris TaxID=2905677 RepID=UPI001FA773E8|nr:hypothetical protein [Pontibacter liquoris]
MSIHSVRRYVRSVFINQSAILHQDAFTGKFKYQILIKLIIAGRLYTAASCALPQNLISERVAANPDFLSAAYLGQLNIFYICWQQ